VSRLRRTALENHILVLITTENTGPLLAVPIEQGDTDAAAFDWSLPRLIAFTRTGETLKLRHTAVALALVGWYLMTPPQTRTWWIGPQRSDVEAPLSRWTNVQSFDKADLCEAARLAAQQNAGDAAPGSGHAVCVASDDPRLKGI
jgi:hypothetical protein